MKKRYILIGVFIVFIFVIALVGSLIVLGNKKVHEEKDIFTIQDNYEKYFTSYGYTIDNPNIIINPYGNSPLTAIVMFDTSDYSKVDVTIKGKNDNDINYTFDNDKHHLIPIYGLYANYENTIMLKSEGKEKIINIETGILPDDFKYVDSSYGNFKFLNGNYPYAVDNNGDVRWYLNKHYYGNISVLDNSKIIVGSDKYTEKGNTISFYQMNLLGKIYNEYLIPKDYYGINYVDNDRVYILSNNLYLIDLQTGKIISDIFKNKDFNFVNVINDEIIVGDGDKCYIYKEKKLREHECIRNNNNYSLYNKTTNYVINGPRKYGTLNQTIISGEKVSLFKYDNKDFDGINFSVDSDRITITNTTGKKVYIILDKLFDRKVYEVEEIKYINKKGLKGKYTIYIKKGKKIYKTNYYIEV